MGLRVFQNGRFAEIIGSGDDVDPRMPVSRRQCLEARDPEGLDAQRHGRHRPVLWARCGGSSGRSARSVRRKLEVSWSREPMRVRLRRRQGRKRMQNPQLICRSPKFPDQTSSHGTTWVRIRSPGGETALLGLVMSDMPDLWVAMRVMFDKEGMRVVRYGDENTTSLHSLDLGARALGRRHRARVERRPGWLPYARWGHRSGHGKLGIDLELQSGQHFAEQQLDGLGLDGSDLDNRCVEFLGYRGGAR